MTRQTSRLPHLNVARQLQLPFMLCAEISEPLSCLERDDA
jgi:hypothetical protein